MQHLLKGERERNEGRVNNTVTDKRRLMVRVRVSEGKDGNKWAERPSDVTVAKQRKQWVKRREAGSLKRQIGRVRRRRRRDNTLYQG